MSGGSIPGAPAPKKAKFVPKLIRAKHATDATRSDALLRDALTTKATRLRKLQEKGKLERVRLAYAAWHSAARHLAAPERVVAPVLLVNQDRLVHCETRTHEHERVLATEDDATEDDEYKVAKEVPLKEELPPWLKKTDGPYAPPLPLVAFEEQAVGGLRDGAFDPCCSRAPYIIAKGITLESLCDAEDFKEWFGELLDPVDYMKKIIGNIPDKDFQ